MHRPARLEPGTASNALFPADANRRRPFAQSSGASTKPQITTRIAGPPEYDARRACHFRGVSAPHCRQRPCFAKTALVRLLRSVVVGMHHDRLRTINDVVARCATPAGVLIVLRVLHRFQETALSPDIFPQTAAHHAEEVLPVGGLAALAEAPGVVMCEHRSTIAPRDLAAERRRVSRIL